MTLNYLDHLGKTRASQKKKNMSSPFLLSDVHLPKNKSKSIFVLQLSRNSQLCHQAKSFQADPIYQSFSYSHAH